MSFWTNYGNTMNTIGHINNGLGALNNYLQAKDSGASTGQSVFSAATNGLVGAARTEYATERYNQFGDSSGFLINSIAGYNGLESNVNGSMGLLMSDPMRFNLGCGFGGYNTMFMPMMPSYGMNPFMMGGNPFMSPSMSFMPMTSTMPMMNPFMGGGFHFHC